MKTQISTALKQAEQKFNIIEEYAALSPERKVLLCDHLFIEGRSTFASTVRLLWDGAEDKDIKKLRMFLQLLKKTANL